MNSRLAGWLTLLCSLTLAWMPGRIPAAPPFIEHADYRGSTDVVLLSSPDTTVTEQDFFLFAVLTKLVEPDLAVRWRELKPHEKELARTNLKLHLEAFYNARMDAGEASAREIELAVRARRIATGPAAQLLWADHVVRESVRIFPEDIISHYRQNPALYSEPDSVTLRRLRVPLAATSTREERDAALRQAEALRAEAATSGGLAPILAKNPALLIDPAGRLVEIKRDAKDVDAQVLNEAFRLGISQISAPIRTPGGYVLVEVVDRRIAEKRDLAQVLPEVETDLQRRFLPQQFDYLLGRAITDAHPVGRAHLFQFLPDDAFILRVGDFDLMMGEFREIYPELIGDPAKPDLPAIQATVGDILGGEVVTQELERLGLAGDPFYLRAADIAEIYQRSGAYIRRERAKIIPTGEEIDAWVAEKGESLQPGEGRVTWEFSMSLRNEEDDLTLGERDAMGILMTGYLDSLVKDAQRQMDDRLQVAGERGLRDPDQVVRQLREPDDRRVQMQFRKIGETTRESTPRLERKFEDFQIGRFTPPSLNRDGRAVSYYISEIVQARPLPPEALRAKARDQIISERVTAINRLKVNDMEKEGKLRFAPELLD